MIGDYLGERSDFNEAVLKAFVELHDFTDLILVQALRQFLWSFRLPGEAQKVIFGTSFGLFPNTTRQLFQVSQTINLLNRIFSD